MLLRDRCWLWGHPEGCFNGKYGLKENSRMTPMECCNYLGIGNTFMIPMWIKADRRKYNMRLRANGWMSMGTKKWKILHNKKR